jgi:hypothetical protein
MSSYLMNGTACIGLRAVHSLRRYTSLLTGASVVRTRATSTAQLLQSLFGVLHVIAGRHYPYQLGTVVRMAVSPVQPLE